MRRRDALCAFGAAFFGGALSGRVAAHDHPTPGATAEGTPREPTESGGFVPLGRLSIAGAKELVVDGNVAYVAVTDGFAVVDVSTPESPTLLAERRGLLADYDGGPLAEIYDGKVGGDYYAVGGPGRDGMDTLHAAAVYDVSDPTDPRRVLTHETTFYHHNLDVDGETLYLCGNDRDRNPLVCIDIASGEELGRWSILDADGRWADADPGLREIHDVWVEDDVAYLAYWNAGTWLLDVSDPTDPTPIVGLRGLDPNAQAALESDAAVRQARFQLPGNDHFVMPQRGVESSLLALNEEAWGETADAPTSDLGGVELWDADGQKRLARIEAPPTDDATYGGVWTTPHNFAFVGDYLYTAWYRGGLKIHDVSDPTNPREVAHWRDSTTTEFWTAQRADACVVTSSYRDPSAENPQEAAAVYTFPAPGDIADTAPAPTETDGAGPGLLAGSLAFGVGAFARRLQRTLD